MAEVFPHITKELAEFINRQHMFFVATAPLSPEGHVNVSPKGMDCFRILGEKRVGYLDVTGSGNETSAHVMENGRITFMFCAFEGDPRILRLYGKGRVVLPGDEEWATLSASFPVLTAARQIIVAEIDRVSTACGFAVPLYDYRGDREGLLKYWQAQGETGVAQYQRENNVQSIDGLPTPLGVALVEGECAG